MVVVGGAPRSVESMLFQCEYVICTSLVNRQPKTGPESTHGLVKDASEELAIFRNILCFCAKDESRNRFLWWRATAAGCILHARNIQKSINK